MPVSRLLEPAVAPDSRLSNNGSKKLLGARATLSGAFDRRWIKIQWRVSRVASKKCSWIGYTYLAKEFETNVNSQGKSVFPRPERAT